MVASTDDTSVSATGSTRGHLDDIAVGRLASTIVRIRDLRGRLTDVAAMRRRLVAEYNRSTIRVARGEHEIRVANQVGRDFCAARARHEVQCLRDEASETEALIGELDLVAVALEVERDVLTAQLGECAHVADSLPTESDRSRARQIIEDAIGGLGLTGLPDQTFTRGDTKQYGQAR